MSLQYIIDGYNIIKHPLFRHPHKNIEDPGISLLTFISLKKLTGSPKNKTTIVFDGYPKTGATDCHDSNISLLFSRKISADEKIKNLVEESASRKTIVVVSDDREIKFMVESLGARSMGVEEFIETKERSRKSQSKDFETVELTYSQKHKINQELRKIWLK